MKRLRDTQLKPRGLATNKPKVEVAGDVLMSADALSWTRVTYLSVDGPHDSYKAEWD